MTCGDRPVRDTLTDAELGFEAGVLTEFIRDLIAAGLLVADEGGRLPRRYARRVRLFYGMAEAGVSLGQMREIFQRGWGNLEIGDLFFPPVSPRSSRSVAEFQASLGSRGELLPRVWAMLGLPELTADSYLAVEDEAVLSAFLSIWGQDAAVAERGGRLMADSVRPLADALAQFSLDQYVRPLVQKRRVQAVPPEMAATAPQIIPRALEMMRWLLGRYMERWNIALGVDNAESLAREEATRFSGAESRRAVVFADLAGYTAETQQMGDARAADLALTLRDQAHQVARLESGRLVKLLGDGAILLFRSTDAAVRATRRMIESWPAELPPLHVGIGVGPVLELDGDAYGGTVNLAARLSAAAGHGQVLVAALSGEPSIASERLVPFARLELKGVAEPVEAFEVVARPGSRRSRARRGKATRAAYPNRHG